MRPSRPTDRRWLYDSIWYAIEAGWRDKPGRRCTISDIHSAFLEPPITVELLRLDQPDAKEMPPLEQPNVEEEYPLGLESHRETQNQAPRIGTGRWRRGKILPRIPSFLQFLRDSGPEIERHVNEMDKVGSSALPNLTQG